MVKVTFSDRYKREVSKIKDASIKERLEKQIIKISQNPEIGKPMMYNRKGTREVYLPPFRLSYSYDKTLDMLYFIEFYHKDNQ